MDNNTPPLLYALTPIDQTDGLKEGAYVSVSFNENNIPFYSKAHWHSEGRWNKIGATIRFTHYLRPLPEGTQVLKPGEVGVNEKELKDLRECKNKLSELEIEYDRLHEEAMIWKYESGNT